ncbi:DNase I-like protein [Phascolomyces articulosus]|uniref:DNase I-like protein n=1 Tax=Phascolomyces articulosus TaxID=60185 RepID=A0AAD5K768_9FUNG|nr:DNase I-like protein [Phascolomyces articulosus]
MVSSISCTAIAANQNPNSVDNIRMVSWNIRMDALPNSISVNETIANLPSGIPSDPDSYFPNTVERPWSERRIAVANTLLFDRADFVGLQEVTKRQLDDLQVLLGNDFAHIGVGREDGKEDGEYSPIFYKKSAAKLINWDTFWLSKSPFEPSKYPGAGNTRICTTAQFKGKSGIFTYMNTHLDHISDEQRGYGLSLVLHRAKYEAIKTQRPVFVTGDFNSQTDQLGYKVITGQAEPLELNSTFIEKYSWSKEQEKDFVFKDLVGETAPERRSGSHATFTGFPKPSDTKSYSRIDFVMAGSTGGWKSNSFRVGETLTDDGLWSSDHKPVYSDISIYKGKY